MISYFINAQSNSLISLVGKVSAVIEANNGGMRIFTAVTYSRLYYPTLINLTANEEFMLSPQYVTVLVLPENTLIRLTITFSIGVLILDDTVMNIVRLNIP